MPLVPSPPEQTLMSWADRIADFEAEASVADTGTGSRREGKLFEGLLLNFWVAAQELAVSRGAKLSTVAGGGKRRWAKLVVGPRILYLPSTRGQKPTERGEQRWLDLAFEVRELVGNHPTEAEAIKRFSPTIGPYTGRNYPNMYDGLSTEFDDTVLLEEAGVLKEKILLEYKTAKSSEGDKIDGNAHERLSFQAMQYLEIATRYPQCSLVVIANSAFVRYRNKYHVNFHVQADRLSAFKWFTMKHICTADQYLVFARGLLDWLFTGNHRDAGGLP